jgi:cation diffusion facilitator family transporter
VAASPSHSTFEPASPQPLYREAIRAAGLGLAVNALLAAVKLAGGILGNSFALIADAVNSLSDVVSTVVVLLAMRLAQRPPDNEHPYGHTRAEGIAASNVAILMIVSALLLGWEAIQRITVSHPIPPVATLWIAAANVVIKESLYRYKRAVGLRIGSAAILANAWDHRSDALCALAVLIGLGAIRWGGVRYLWADEAASLCVAAAIIWSGSRLFYESGVELMDVQADPELVEEIRREALTVAGVQDVEKLRVRKSGLEYFVDIHIEVDSRMTVADGHKIGHDVKDQIVGRFATVRDVLVHLEPHQPE